MFKEALALMTELVKSPVAGWRVAVLLIIGGHISWACGWLPGMTGFALEAQEVARETAVTKRLESIEEKQNIGLRLALAAEICRIYRLRNMTTDPLLRDTLASSFDQKQDDYANVNRGVRYPAIECP